MTGALGLPGGIAASNLNVMHALGDLAVGEGIGWTVLSLLEEERHRPPFLAPDTGYRAYEGNRVAFASALLAHAVRRPLFVFDWIGLARPLLPLAFARLARTVVFAHGWEYWRTLSTVDRWSIERATLNLTNSEYTLRRMRARIPRFEGRACPLGLSPQFPLNREAPPPSPDRIEMTACDGNVHVLGDRVLLLVARMDPTERMKGHSDLLNVLPDLLRRHPEAQLVFPGPGQDIPLHVHRAKELGVASSVFLPGMVSVEILARLYRRCYAFTMPSKQEGFGMVYLEAMNYAKACVGCFDDGGEDVIVHGDTGYLVRNPADPTEMFAVLEALFEDPARTRAMGARGFERLHARFTSAQYQKRIQDEIAPLAQALR
jgi:phosphatidylinositol alpha-1,6-mannosyltransferase